MAPMYEKSALMIVLLISFFIILMIGPYLNLDCLILDLGIYNIIFI